MKKRYAIVRVDGNHKPSHFEVESIENIADLKLLDNVVKTYGDTKEQLERKVTQALVRARIEEVKNSKSLSWDQIATRIVEFLGVVE